MSTKINFYKGPPCDTENCRSRRYYDDDGHTYCKAGHEQIGVQTQHDDDDGGRQGRKTRQKRERPETISQISRGHTATEIFIQSYQLILWKQCYALIHTVGLPAELEQVVKDLWALRLQLVKEKVGTTSEEDTSFFSSQPVSEVETEDEEQNTERKYKARGKAMPKLIETLALLYMGMVLLRLPVSMGEIHRWAIREDIVYIRAIREIPPVMKRQLPPEYQSALDTTTPLEPDHLRKAIHSLSLFYSHHFKLNLPQLSTTLLLYKHIRNLALPVTLHQITLSITTLHNLPFTFPSHTHRQRTSSLPELTLISLLVIATKLYHPFNEDPSHPKKARSLTDPATLRLNWSIWVTAQKAHHARLNPEGHLARGTEINITEEDVMAMTSDGLDEYLDFYERTFVDEARAETKPRGLPKQLLDMFPTGRQDGSSPTNYSYSEHTAKEQASTKEMLNDVVGSFAMRPFVASTEDGNGDDADDDEERIGDSYQRFRHVEDLGEDARFFHGKVAEAVAVRLETLLLCVWQMETRLLTLRKAQAKKMREEGEMSGIQG